MARLERGKGNRQRRIEIQQRGTLLTKDEVDGPSVLLRGYRQLASESAARAALEEAVMHALAEGLAAVDEEARAIVASLPTASTAKPKLPIRRDLFVYNEATGFLVTALRMAGKQLAEGSAKWKRAVAKGDMLPVILFQDDPFVVRVVVGGELEPAEAEEWVSRIDHHVNVRDGKLCITGGAVFASEDYDPDDGYYDRFVRTLEVPKGHYRASVHAYVPGINGRPVLDHLAGGYGAHEPLGRWFRRTRPGEAFPAWLRNECAGDPAADPGHEDEWKDAARLADGERPDYVQFLVHLTPVDEPPTEGLSEAEDGWFGEAWNARVPSRCPLGLEARGLVGRVDESSSDWIFAFDVFRTCDARTPAPIDGGPVALPVSRFPRAFRAAWFASRHAVPALRIKPPARATLDASGPWPEGVVAARADGALEVIVSSDVAPADAIARLAELGARIAALPDGTALELCAAPPESAMQYGPPEAGVHVYRGEVRGGTWRIDASYPAVDAAALRGALELAGEIEGGARIAVADEAEAREIVAWTKANYRYHVEEHAVEIEGGFLRLREADPSALALFGIGAFALRYGDVWPVVDLAALADGDDGEDGDEDEDLHVDTGAATSGAEVLRAASGRTYAESSALALGPKVVAQIEAEAPALAAAGFEHVADVVCSQFPNIVVRSYARPSGTAWATILAAAPHTAVLELSSRFGDGASLLTNRNPAVGDDPHRTTYRQGFAGADLNELLAKHEARLAELEPTHGPPLMTIRTAKGLAESVEAALRKQLGG